jgi:hypothetical protein
VLCGQLGLEIDGPDVASAPPGGQAGLRVCILLASAERAADRDARVELFRPRRAPKGPRAAVGEWAVASPAADRATRSEIADPPSRVAGLRARAGSRSLERRTADRRGSRSSAAEPRKSHGNAGQAACRR